MKGAKRSGRAPRRVEPDSSLSLLDLLSNVLVAIMVLALIALATMGPGGAERRGGDEGRSRRTPVHGFSVVAETDGGAPDNETAVLVQLATGSGDEHGRLAVRVNGGPATAAEARWIQGSGRRNDPEPRRQWAALLLPEAQAARHFDLELVDARDAVGLAWRVAVGSVVILAGRDEFRSPVSGTVLTVCIDERGVVSAGIGGDPIPGCRKGA